MPAILANANNFLFNTDYPLDKVIYLFSGSYTQIGETSTTVVVAHGLTFRPLVTGNWSKTVDFTSTKEMFLPEFSDITSTYVQVFSNDTNITIRGIKPTAGNETIYYRIYGFMPSNVNTDVAFTASLADSFQLSTDYNYTKLNETFSGFYPAAATTTITHNLGYRPQVMAWTKDINIYGTGIINQDHTSYILPTTTTIVIKSATKDVHLRVYMDSQL